MDKDSSCRMPPSTHVALLISWPRDTPRPFCLPVVSHGNCRQRFRTKFSTVANTTRPSRGRPSMFRSICQESSPRDLLTVCNPQNQRELHQFTHYAAISRSDGEAMRLAVAEERKWGVATDDRRAIRVAQQAGLTVVSSPELVKVWA